MTEPAVPVLLLVDDEPSIVNALRRMFRRSPYAILSAPDGLQALAVLEKERVDVVVTDMRMPGMDGVTLLQEVARRWPATTRVLLSGYAESGPIAEAVTRGFVQHCVTKPWDDDELQRLVARAVTRPAAGG